MRQLCNRIAAKLREKRGAAGLIWATVMLFVAVGIIIVAAIVSSTYLIGNDVKQDIKNAGTNALTQESDADYGQNTLGYSDPSLFEQACNTDVSSYLQSIGYSVSGSNAVRKNSGGQKLYELDDIATSTVENDGSVSGTLTALKITFVYKRSVLFSGKAIPEVSVPLTVYVYKNPKGF